MSQADLEKLPNIGPVVAKQLCEVGITTPENLRQIGSREAWLRIQQIDASACYNRLLGLEGAVLGIKKNQLSPEEKADLKLFYQKHHL